MLLKLTIIWGYEYFKLYNDALITNPPSSKLARKINWDRAMSTITKYIQQPASTTDQPSTAYLAAAITTKTKTKQFCRTDLA
ncbi:unnamed protein product [Absidia cylindrospora]